MLRVKSIRVEPTIVVLVGSVPSNALDFKGASESPGYLQARSLGNLRLTWSSLLHSNAGDDVGYLVLQTPVEVEGPLSESEDDDRYWVALAIERTLHTLPAHSIAAVCCARCNRPIPQQRVLAVPNTKVCTNCQQKKEKKNDRGNQ